MIYLAYPLFSEGERAFGLAVATKIESLGFQVYLPWRDAGDAFYQRKFDGDPIPVARAIYDENCRAIRRSQVVVALLEGSDAEAGVSWELGFATAIGKRIVGLRTDFRSHTANGPPINIMPFCSASTVVRSVDGLLAILEGEPRPRTLTPQAVYEFYDAVATEYDDAVLHPRTACLRREAQHLVDALVGGLEVNRLLDIGGGSSDIADHIPARETIVVDPSYGLLGRRRYPAGMASIATPIEAVSLPSRSMDCIVCNLAIDHIDRPEALLDRCAEWLRPGGSLIIVHQNPDEEQRLRRDPGHFTFYCYHTNVIYRVKSRMHVLGRLPSVIPRRLRLAEHRRTPAPWHGLAGLVGLRCAVVA